jgi:hypothetical protein
MIKMKFFFATRDKNGVQIPQEFHQSVVAEFLTEVLAQFGGATGRWEDGYWLNPSNPPMVVNEEVYTVDVNVTSMDTGSVCRVAQQAAEKIRERLNQTAAYAEILEGDRFLAYESGKGFK